MSACEEAFSISELAGEIFLNLTTRDIPTGVTQTCRTWQHTTTSSKRIQQALFFEPVSDGPYSLHRTKSGYKWRDKDGKVIKDYQIYFNPIVEAFLAVWRPLQQRRELVLYPQASWRKQILAQPPLGNMRGRHDNWEDLRPDDEAWEIRAGDGTPGSTTEQYLEPYLPA